MVDVLTSIASGFNALNIVWFNDPDTRRIYRKWIAGPPYAPNNSAGENLFSKDVNYTHDWWYIAGQYFPIISDGGNSIAPNDGRGGIIPQQARALFLRYYPRSQYARGHKNFFIQAVGLTLSIPATIADRATHNTIDLEVQNNVENDPFIVAYKRSVCPLPYDWGAPCGSGLLSVADPNIGGEAIYLPTGQHDDTSRFPAQQIYVLPYSDWRTMFIGTTNEVAGTELDPGQILLLYPSMQSYLPWLLEWATSLVARTPTQIIQDSRAYVIFENMMQAQFNGGLESFLSFAMNQPSYLVQQRTATRPEVEAAAQAAFAIGGALAAETYGISALVGGAVGAGLMIGDRLVTNTIKSSYRDDIGRFKPALERAWLSVASNPPIVTGIQSSPPFMTVPAPPGYTPPLQTMITATSPVSVVRFGPPPQPASSSSGMSTTTKVIAGAAVVTAAYFGYRYIAGSKMVMRSNPRRHKRMRRRVTRS